MLDSQLFGSMPQQHKLTNLLLHIINTALVFWLLYKLTGKDVRAFVVAVLFGLHPLHVESVVWISERKDLLCSAFYLLSIIAYLHYVTRRTRAGTLIVLLTFLLALLSKPMAVTLPFTLLLLDFWPLNRAAFTPQSPQRQQWTSARVVTGYEQRSVLSLVCEKLPLIALSMCVSAVTFVAQNEIGATRFVEVPFVLRIVNGAVAYMAYLEKTFWPSGLSVLYPHPIVWSDGVAFLSLIGVSALIVGAVWAWRNYPYLTFGILWFLGTLLPALGLIQVGGQSMANRYTYIPHIGLFCALVWLGSVHIRLATIRAKLLFSTLFLILSVGMISATRFYVHKWDTPELLWKYALNTTQRNYVASSTLRRLADASGRYLEALGYAKITVAYDPVPYNLVMLGRAYLRAGQPKHAVTVCRTELQNQEDGSYANFLTGLALSRNGREADAIPFFEAAHETRPREWIVSVELARILSCSPDPAVRNEAKAYRHARRAAILTGFKAPLALDALAAACAGIGQFDMAEQVAEKAISLALVAADAKLVQLAEEKRSSYHNRVRCLSTSERYDYPL